MLRYLLFFLLGGVPILHAPAMNLDSLTQNFLQQPALSGAHVSIYLYDVKAQKTILAVDTQKKMIPASNLKILTVYLALKYLPDSLPSFYYQVVRDTFNIQPLGDPTLLHPGFEQKRCLELWRNKAEKVRAIRIYTGIWQEKHFAKGWIWDDYPYYFMPENSVMPLMGNVLTFSVQKYAKKNTYAGRELSFTPVLPFITLQEQRIPGKYANGYFTVSRVWHQNIFFLKKDKYKFRTTQVPVRTEGSGFARQTLQQLLKKKVLVQPQPVSFQPQMPGWQPFYNQALRPTLKYMMRQSDNFFAEQILLTMSAWHLGYMNRESFIKKAYAALFSGQTDTLSWVDASGLSVYNLMSTAQMGYILNRLYRERGWQEITQVFPTGDEGTLQGFFVKERGQIYLKTGSMNGVFCLSGYLIHQPTRKPYAFSIFINGVMMPVDSIKRLIEQYLTRIMGVS